MASRTAPRIGQPDGTRVTAVSCLVGGSVALLLAAIGGLSLAFLASDARARAVLATLPDHPWWLVYRAPPGDDGAAWAVGASTAAALLAAATLFAGRRWCRRWPELPALAAGLFLLMLGFECLRGATAFLVVTDRSLAAAHFLSRVVCWARFTGLLSLLAVSLHALDLPDARPGVLLPVALVASLAMAASVPVDRTAFLAELTFRLGDEQGVWFVELVIGALIPLSVIAAAVVRREARLARLAVALALLLVGRELLFFSLRPARLAGSLVLLVGGSALLVWELGRPYGAARETRSPAAGTENSAR